MTINTANNEINETAGENDYTKAPYNIVANQHLTAASMQAALSTKQSALPIGTVIMFNGSSWNNNTLPGWYICNGQTVATPNGQSTIVPNLVDKFIRAGTSAQDVPASTNNRQLAVTNLPAHTHSVSGTLANHTHSTHGHGTASMRPSTGSVVTVATTGSSTSGGASTTSVTGTASGGGNESALGTAFDVIPKHYYLIYIIRVW